MKRFFKIFRRRYLILLPLLVLLGFLIEVREIRRTLQCVYCDSTGEETSVWWWVLGWNGRSVGVREIEEHRFFDEYPEFSCDHRLKSSEGRHSYFWNSPFLEAGNQYSPLWSTRFAIVARYASDDDFREAIRKLEAEGAVSRELILEVASCHCMCGGRCRIPYDSAEQNPLRELLDSAEENKN